MHERTKIIDDAYYYAGPRDGKMRLKFFQQNGRYNGTYLGQATFEWNPPGAPLTEAILREKLKEVRGRDQLPAAASNNGNGAAVAPKDPAKQAAPKKPAKPAAPAGSLEAVLESVFEDLCPQWAEGTRAGFRRTKDFLLDSLTPVVAHRPLKKVDPKSYSVVAVELDKDKTIEGSKYFRKQDLKRLTWELVARGLPKECAKVFDGVKTKSPHLKHGRPYSDLDIYRMYMSLAGQPYAVRLLFWIGFSGGPEIGDAASLMITEVNRDDGKVRLERQKTGGVAEFVLVREGLECLLEREFAESQRFVLPELIKGARARAAEEDNIKLDDDATFAIITDVASRLWDAFETKAKLNEKEIHDEETGKSYKSFRQELTTRSLSANVPLSLVARVHGSGVASVRTYDFPEDLGLTCARLLREEHLAAIKRGRRLDYVLTDQQLLAKLERFIKAYLRMTSTLAERRQQAVLAKLNQASEKASGRVRDGMAQLERSQLERYRLLVAILQAAAWQATVLERRLKEVSRAVFGADIDAEWEAASGRPGTDGKSRDHTLAGGSPAGEQTTDNSHH
jgi:hypothetical protein